MSASAGAARGGLPEVRGSEQPNPKPQVTEKNCRSNLLGFRVILEMGGAAASRLGFGRLSVLWRHRLLHTRLW